MFERLALAVLIGLACVGLYLAWTRWQLWRVRRLAVAPGLDELQAGKSAVLYFTAPGCVPCRTVQAPALEVLQADLGAALQVIKIDASARPDVADYWGVLSVPTTFVLDRQGRARRVNHGVASADKLRGQLEEVGVFAPGTARRRAAPEKAEAT
jgi:thiol-disulfide isomerase/thioredoxin